MHGLAMKSLFSVQAHSEISNSYVPLNHTVISTVLMTLSLIHFIGIYDTGNTYEQSDNKLS